MAKLPQMFDANTVEPQGISTQLPVSGPEGYPVIISGSEFVASKNNANNGYLRLDLQVIEGEHTGATGAYRLNLFHENPKTVEIAYRQLSAVCHCVSVFQVGDSAQLHNIPFRAVVGFQKRPVDWKDGDPEYTEVKGVLSYDGSAPGKSKGGAQTANAAPPTPPPAQPQQTAPAAAQPAWGGQQQQQVQEAAPAAQASWQQAPVTAAAPPWQK